MLHEVKYHNKLNCSYIERTLKKLLTATAIQSNWCFNKTTKSGNVNF